MTAPSQEHRGLSWLAVLASLAVGLGVGGVGAWTLKPADVRVREIPKDVVRDYTEDELRIACLPYMRGTATTLEEAETRVAALEVQVRRKADEIADLERRLEDDAPVASELAQARSQLDVLQAALQLAQAEKTALLETLATTREELAVAQVALEEKREEAEVAREDAVTQRWQAFVVDAQLGICSQGSKARVERCRDVVAKALAPHQNRFKDCVRSGQAIPELGRAPLLDEGPDDLPGFAIRLDPSDRLVQDWYVLFCDAQLPEADRD